MDVLLAASKGRILEQPASLESPECMYSLQFPKIPHAAILTSVYWLVDSKLPKLMDHLVLRPARNPMITGSSQGSPIAVYHKHATRKDVLGIPRFLGISLFGIPADDRRTSGTSIDVSFTKDLFSHQETIVHSALDILHEWGGTTIIADCGVGKTGMALYLLAALKRKTIVICNRTILMDQWKDSIQKFLTQIKVTTLQGTESLDDALTGDIIVASIDTVIVQTNHEVFSSIGLVIVDEMHHIAAASFVHCLPLFSARYILGLTATPTRNDGLEHALYWLCGPVCAVYQRVPEITGKRGTVKVHKITFREGNKKEVVYYNGTLGFSAMITELTMDEARNNMLKDLILTLSHRKKIVFVTSSVYHAVFFYKWYKESSEKPAALMAGKSKNRDAAKKATFVSATYSMLEEGYDDPELDTLILGTPRSTVQQTIGRIERDHPGKLVPVVYDIVDDFSLYPNMFWKRNKFYSSRGFDVAHL